MDLPVAQRVKNLPAMQETRDQSLSWEVPLEKGMAIHSSILVWRNPWTEKPGWLQSVGSQRVRHDWATNTHTDAFLDLSCFLDDPMDVGNLIYCSSAFSKFSLNIYIRIHTEMYLCMLLSCFNHVWLCATPETAAHQAPSFLGFSRQEHWSALPFPSPMHESEKWKWSRSVMSDS